MAVQFANANQQSAAYWRNEASLVGTPFEGLEFLRSAWRTVRDMRKAGLPRDKEQQAIATQRSIEQAANEITEQMMNAAMQEKERQEDEEAYRPAPRRSERITQDGMYRDPDTGDIYKVQYNKGEGDGRRLYAKILVVVQDAERDAEGKVLVPAKVRFDYVRGVVFKLRPEWRLTLEQAQQFGALYGTCIRCGRDLTREDSIERKMGKTCFGKMGW